MHFHDGRVAVGGVEFFTDPVDQGVVAGRNSRGHEHLVAIEGDPRIR